MSLPDWCPPYSGRKVSPTTGEEVFCICKKPDTGKLMVGCDGCDDWFHFSCMKLPDQYKDLVFSFYCPYCQVGITGPASRCIERTELPHTIWKRKCRLHNCFKECKPNSKYCCEEHGELYIRQALTKLEIEEKNREEQESLILRMAKYVKATDGDDGFQKIGNSQFIEQNIGEPHDTKLYATLLANDKRLAELNREYYELEMETIPRCKQTIELLNIYLEWLNEVNDKLFAEDVTQDGNIERSRKKKNTPRKKQKRTICGYIPNFTKLPLTIDEFVERYDGTKVVIEGVCTKLKCNKHHEWSAMSMQQSTNQIRSAQNHQERIAWLINTRREQLNIQYYEQLLRRKI